MCVPFKQYRQNASAIQLQFSKSKFHNKLSEQTGKFCDKRLEKDVIAKTELHAPVIDPKIDWKINADAVQQELQKYQFFSVDFKEQFETK